MVWRVLVNKHILRIKYSRVKEVMNIRESAVGEGLIRLWKWRWLRDPCVQTFIEMVFKISILLWWTGFLHKVQHLEITLNTLFHVFPNLTLQQVASTLRDWHFFMQLFSSIHSTWPNQCNLLSCTLHLRHLMPNLSFNTLALCYAYILTLHIQWRIPAPFLSSLYMCSAFKAIILLPCSIAVLTQAFNCQQR